MKNAKDELIEIISTTAKVRCAYIYVEKVGKDKSIFLQENYIKEEFERFLQDLDFKYSNGFFSKTAINGVIWLVDGSWIERANKDDKYSWERVTIPTIPSFLKRR